MTLFSCKPSLSRESSRKYMNIFLCLLTFLSASSATELTKVNTKFGTVTQHIGQAYLNVKPMVVIQPMNFSALKEDNARFMIMQDEFETLINNFLKNIPRATWYLDDKPNDEWQGIMYHQLHEILWEFRITGIAYNVSYFNFLGIYETYKILTPLSVEFSGRPELRSRRDHNDSSLDPSQLALNRTGRFAPLILATVMPLVKTVGGPLLGMVVNKVTDYITRERSAPRVMHQATDAMVENEKAVMKTTERTIESAIPPDTRPIRRLHPDGDHTNVPNLRIFFGLQDYSEVMTTRFLLITQAVTNRANFLKVVRSHLTERNNQVIADIQAVKQGVLSPNLVSEQTMKDLQTKIQNKIKEQQLQLQFFDEITQPLHLYQYITPFFLLDGEGGAMLVMIFPMVGKTSKHRMYKIRSIPFNTQENVPFQLKIKELVRVQPIAVVADGIVIHNLDHGKNYTLSRHGEWQNVEW